jgi:hypothetical protein
VILWVKRPALQQSFSNYTKTPTNKSKTKTDFNPLLDKTLKNTHTVTIINPENKGRNNNPHLELLLANTKSLPKKEPKGGRPE